MPNFKVVLIALALLTTPAHAIILKDTPDYKGGTVITMSGNIVENDGKKFMDYVTEILHRSKTSYVSTLFLESGGGIVNEAHLIANLVRALNMNTAVAADTECVSACFEIWAAGTEIFIGPNAKVAGHRLSERGGIENSETRLLNKVYAKFMRDWGVPDSIVDRIMHTPPKSLYYLSNKDIVAMGGQRYR